MYCITFNNSNIFVVQQQTFVKICFGHVLDPHPKCVLVPKCIVLVNAFVAFCRTLSTPNEESWPGVSQLPDYKTSFPSWHTNVLPQSVKNLDDIGLELLQV